MTAPSWAIPIEDDEEPPVSAVEDAEEATVSGPPEWAEPIVEEAPAEGTGIDLGAMGKGAIQGMTLGFGDEAAGFGAAMADAAIGGEPTLRTTERGLDAPLDIRTEYEVGQAEAERENVQAMKLSPGSYLMGELAGGVAASTGLGFGGLARVGARGLAKAGARGLAKMGAGGLAKRATAPAAGLIEGVGTGVTEALGRDTDVGAGAAIGASFPLAGMGARALGSKMLGDPAQRFMASDLAKLRQAGVSPAAVAKLGRKPGKLERTAGDIRELAKTGGARGLQTTPGIQSSIEEGLAKARTKMDDINAAATASQAVVNGAEVAAEVRQLASRYKRLPGGKKIVSDIQGIAAELVQAGVMSLKNANTARQLIFESLKLDSPLTAGKVGNKIYASFRRAMERSIAEKLGENVAQEWSRVNRLVSTGIQSSEAGMQRSAVEAGQKVPTFFAGMGAAVGDDALSGGLKGMAVGQALSQVGKRSRGIRSGYQQALGRMAQGASGRSGQVARSILGSMQTPGISGAVELYKAAQVDPEFREELNEEEGAR